MNITIREISETDAPQVAALSRQLGYNMADAVTAAQIRHINNSGSDTAWAALDGHHMVGWIHVFHTIRLESLPYCEIGGLVIDENYRGKGIGKQLIEHIKPWCRQKNCTTLRVRTNTKRADAHQFYRHTGFTETKQQKIFDIIL